MAGDVVAGADDDDKKNKEKMERTVPLSGVKRRGGTAVKTRNRVFVVSGSPGLTA